jgi:hypothetical protein
MDNKTFLETLSSYLPRKIGIKIYHRSPEYFHQYQYRCQYRIPFFYFYYFINCGNFNKGDFSYNSLEPMGPSGCYSKYVEIPIDKCFLNDFVKFKLKKPPNIGLLSFRYILLIYHKEDIAIDTIKRYWKKYRWDYLRNLAAVKYHPSKIDFTI